MSTTGRRFGAVATTAVAVVAMAAGLTSPASAAAKPCAPAYAKVLGHWVGVVGTDKWFDYRILPLAGRRCAVTFSGTVGGHGVPKPGGFTMHEVNGSVGVAYLIYNFVTHPNRIEFDGGQSGTSDPWTPVYRAR